jgi:hypothetical protein
LQGCVSLGKQGLNRPDFGCQDIKISEVHLVSHRPTERSDVAEIE